MKIDKNYYFKLWLGLVFIYLILKMEDILEISLIGSTTQLFLLYVAYALGILFFFIYREHVVNRFIFFTILFVGLGIVSTLIWGRSLTNLLHDIVYMSFWLLALRICFCCREILVKDRFIVHMLVISDVLMIFSFIFWFLNGGRSSVAAVNAVYFITCLFPIVFLDINKYIRIFIIVSSTASALLSAKRTAFIVLVLAFSLPYMIRLLRSGRKNKLRTIVSLIVLLLLIVYLYDYLLVRFNITIFERFQSISEDGGSGRLDIYSSVIEAFRNSGIMNKLLGHGYNGVFNYGVTYTSAHNDFLEVLYDNGLIGLLLYLSFIVKLIITTIKLLKSGKEIACAVLSALMVFLCMSITSHLIIYPTYFIYIVVIVMMGQSALDERGADENIAY